MWMKNWNLFWEGLENIVKKGEDGGYHKGFFFKVVKIQECVLKSLR